MILTSLMRGDSVGLLWCCPKCGAAFTCRVSAACLSDPLRSKCNSCGEPVLVTFEVLVSATTKCDAPAAPAAGLSSIAIGEKDRGP